MASMYGELISAKREIKVAVENSEKDYLVITNAMNTKMSGRLDSPLHMVAYILNPKYSYADPSIFTDVEVVVALMEVMETFYHDDDMKQNKVFNIDFTKFKKKEGMFGKVAALKAMENNNFDAGDWWSTYGLQTPTLQHMAIRILNLTTGSSGCERNWSTFEMVDAKRGNKLDVARRDNLVYIQFDGRMIDKRKKLSSSSDVLLGEDASRAQDWICEDAYIDDEFDPTTGVPYNIIDEAMEESKPIELCRSARVRELHEVEEYIEDDDDESNHGVDMEDDEIDYESGDDGVMATKDDDEEEEPRSLEPFVANLFCLLFVCPNLMFLILITLIPISMCVAEPCYHVTYLAISIYMAELIWTLLPIRLVNLIMNYIRYSLFVWLLFIFTCGCILCGCHLFCIPYLCGYHLY
ncbi:uncharacterized protein [Aegilops tauschii subsp. strangulata]|nr:uncharacterized protein LOC109741601 isoform X2 [Aegilops tauschii subsp. strangulata]